jgi:SPP1 gp7 family putative phage head morphogenesis protein
VTWFRDRLVMTDDEFQSIETASHATAFTVAGVAQLDLVTQVWEAADRAVAQGETLESFQKSMGAKLAAAWGKDMPWRVETIYRTNVQSAYSRGRWLQMNHPAVLRARPWRKFSAIMDSRTSPICGPCDGVVRAADDPWWQQHVPPLHHNCRSHLVTLSDEEAKAEGVSKDTPNVDADVGFGEAPSPVPRAAWQPDLSQYPSVLAHVYHTPTA